MGATPGFKVYDGNDGEYVGAAKYPLLAAAMIAALPDRSTVKFNGRIVWREGDEEVPAAESYDNAAHVMETRIEAHRAQKAARLRNGLSAYESGALR